MARWSSGKEQSSTNCCFILHVFGLFATLGSVGNDIITACHDGFLHLFSRDPVLAETEGAIELLTQLLYEVEVPKLSNNKYDYVFTKSYNPKAERGGE